MPTVFRIQDQDGRGPWKPGFSDTWVGDRTQEEYAELKPIYEEFPDIVQKIRGHKFVGVACKTPEGLRKWIREDEYVKLRLLGYRVVAMKVESIICESDVQCVVGRRVPLKRNVREINLYPSKNHS